MPRTSRPPAALRPARTKSGFTLVELLVVIAVIGVLVALLLPAVSAAREAARRTSCSNNLRQLAIGLHSYATMLGSFPAGCVEPNRKRIAWSVYLLPFIEYRNVYDRFDTSRPYTALESREATTTLIPVYLCPSTARVDADRINHTSGDKNKNGAFDQGDWMAMTDYGGLFGIHLDPAEPFIPNGVMIYDRAFRPRDITDGLSHTIVVAEDTGRGWKKHGEWANGENIFLQEGPPNLTNNNEMFAEHPAGLNVALCDGSVRFLAETIDLDSLTALCTRDASDLIVIPP